jgi:nucleotide-binding universal stress UspA family protein
MYTTILAALDGSAPSTAGGRVALRLAKHFNAQLRAAHVYDAGIHSTRFREMEPGLPDEYQGEDTLRGLRYSHVGLMEEGFEALSKGYLDDLLHAANEAEVKAEEIIERGRRHALLLRMAEEHAAGLIVLGAEGIGSIGDGMLGSTTTRVLRRASCDVLVARAESEGPVLVGVDGSEGALAALRKGAEWARVLDLPLHVAAVYDTAFHQRVFQVMADSLSEETRSQVGLEKQKGLHHQFIDEGLRELYQGFLNRAEEMLASMDGRAEPHLLDGKAYDALVRQAEEIGAGLIAVGRFGHHHEGAAQIGATAEAVVRRSRRSVLVTSDAAPLNLEPRARAEEIPWDKDALARLQRIPSVARAMARRGVEEYVRSQGEERVTLDAFLEVAKRLGMGRSGDQDSE